MGSILLFATVIGILLYLYWKGRNAKEETIDKNLIQGIIIADILAALVIHGVITSAEADFLSNSSLSEVEEYVIQNTNLTKDEFGEWIHHDWDGIQAIDLPLDLDPG
ncbi:hypothetical protein [Alkalihalobacillus sp. CinArs1]|uniref:hypothetical protein n=1 Tax=Alkalihalobacillus sp. CinArs1 TaxID=2995314 RepID=UPI0022DE8B9A|nr:hypothetical protein [Alkalihalobacillus sp. CinArs1]